MSISFSDINIALGLSSNTILYANSFTNYFGIVPRFLIKLGDTPWGGVIAPIAQQGAKLVGTGYVGSPSQGYSVALSSDGNTLAVGGTGDNGGIGATWIFSRNTSTGQWSEQQKLVGEDAIGTSRQGSSVALSSDGNTLAVGGTGDNGNFKGATWIFTRSGTNWSQQQKLVGGSVVNGYLHQGSSVALSSDGNTLAVGGYGGRDSNLIPCGATWIFSRNTSTGQWSEQQKLVGNVPAYGQYQGISVALSSDGNTLAVGGEGDNNNTGATWIFVRNTSTGEWSQQQKLVGDDPAQGQFQGSSVALSGDGNTLAVGGRRDNNDTGATWIFTRSGTNWTQQGSKLIGMGYVGSPSQGYSVALSYNGNVLAIGGYLDNSSVGATWIFIRYKTDWTQLSKLVGTGYVGTVKQGFDVALSSSGKTLAIGGFNDNTNIGATWVFTPPIFTQQQKLVDSTAISAQQGRSVALSSDGNTLAVGGWNDNDAIGATWIFIRSGTTWTQQAKLVGEDVIGASSQGYSVALSSDGNTLAVGGRGDNNNTGATWIFVRNTSTGQWSQQQKLVGTGYVGTAQQGIDVALSSDGNTLAVGGDGDDANKGATWIFTRSGTNWSEQQKLVGNVPAAYQFQGISVALSSDGNTLAVGGYGDNGGIGATWIFSRNTSTGQWSEQQKLVDSTAIGARQGRSVALSSDGNTLAVGGYGDSNFKGATWIFTRSGTNWSQPQKLVDSTAINAQQGISVALSSDGNILAVGGYGDSNYKGATWIFTRSGATWSQQQKLVGDVPAQGQSQGWSIALSSDGNILAVGGWGDNNNTGATWIFNYYTFSTY